ncbi:MAG: hypothetical protein HOV92_12625 [Streptomyces sp.]|nr:hypothetical protein [Streptomyces sp.]
MKKRLPQIVICAVAILLAARLTWLSARHDMPAFDTLTIGLFALYGAHAGASYLASVVQTARQNGGTR